MTHDIDTPHMGHATAPISARVAVIGAGYVGLVTAACLASLGHRVRCIEADQGRLDSLRRGRAPFQEPGLAPLIDTERAAGRLTFAGLDAPMLGEASIVFLAVQTPQGAGGAPETRYLDEAVAWAVPRLARKAVLVIKSTVPVGTGDAMARRLAEAGRSDVEVASNPEFLRQGTAVQDFLQPDRVVLGSAGEAAAATVAMLYEPLGAPIMHCDRRSAELAKYAANAALALRVSFINEIASLCEGLDADVDLVAAIIGADRRIGPAFLQAGLGWGGSCFPKDVAAIGAMARRMGQPARLMEAAVEVNDSQRELAVGRLLAALPASDARVVVLGLAFKPLTDDLRGSPAVAVIRQLQEAGVAVRVHDPVAGTAQGWQPTPGVQHVEDVYAAVCGADALLLATDWPEYSTLAWDAIRRLMRGRFVLDGRNALDSERLRRSGFIYAAFGRGRPRGTAFDGLEPSARSRADPWPAGTGQARTPRRDRAGERSARQPVDAR